MSINCMSFQHDVLTQENMMSDFFATSVTVSVGIAPSAFNGSPRDSVRFVYTKAGAPELVKYF